MSHVTSSCAHDVAISHTQDLGDMSHIHICRKTSRHIFMSLTNESYHIFIYVAILHTQVYHNPWDLGLVGNVASVLGTRDAPYNWYLTEWCNWNELCPYMCMSRAPYMYIWIYNMAHSYMCVGHPRCTLQLEFEWMMSHICIWVISHICIYNVTHSYMCVGHPQSTLRLESGRGMASSSRLLKIIGLFCKRAL